MRHKKGPLPGVGMMHQIAADAMVPLMDIYSGEITANVKGKPLGAANLGGRVSEVFLSVEESGKDDTNTLSIEGDVFINGTSCLTTKPKIAHVSGEASQQKTTVVTGDTGITQSVMDPDNNAFSIGDVFSYDFNLTRTASPTTEIKHPVIVVRLEPT